MVGPERVEGTLGDLSALLLLQVAQTLQGGDNNTSWGVVIRSTLTAKRQISDLSEVRAVLTVKPDAGTARMHTSKTKRDFL